MIKENKDVQPSPVKQRREELGLTQRELATLCGLTIQTISNIETGRYKKVKLEPKQFKGVCRALNWNTLEEIPDDWLR